MKLMSDRAVLTGYTIINRVYRVVSGLPDY